LAIPDLHVLVHDKGRANGFNSDITGIFFSSLKEDGLVIS
jgi:hypothetical protein